MTSRFLDYFSKFSPNSRQWIPYASTESGRAEVYVQPYPQQTGNGESRRKAGTFRDGRATAGNCSTWRRTEP